MGWTSPFSFRGSIGRRQLWAVLLLAGAVELAATAIPVTRHHLVLSRYGGSGESYFNYVTPAEPITWASWALFAASVLVTFAAFWATVAAMTKRLHDLDRSGKWIAVVFGGLALSTFMEVVFPPSGEGFSAGDIGSLAILAPTALLGAFGMFEMLVVGGAIGRRRDLPESDLRRSIR